MKMIFGANFIFGKKSEPKLIIVDENEEYVEPIYLSSNEEEIPFPCFRFEKKEDLLKFRSFIDRDLKRFD